MEQNTIGGEAYFSTETFISHPSVTFVVSDFGCIQQGEFQLKPLTVFCGRNNTGKTWTMYALYGILSGLDIEDDLPEMQFLADQLETSGQVTWNPILWIDKHFALVEKIIQQAINKKLPDTLNTSADVLEHSVFNYSLSKSWVKKYLSQLHLNFILATIGGQPALEAQKVMDHPEITFTVVKTGLSNLKQLLTKFIVSRIAGSRYLGFGSPFLLPSERNGLNLVFRELNFTRAQSLHAGRLNFTELDDYLKRLSLYAKPIADYIDWLNTLSLSNSSVFKVVRPVQSVVADIEKISGGSYTVDAHSRISFISEGIQSDLHLASSTANSMAGLWFYMNGDGVGKGVGTISTLMIDEPELNLHPSNQRTFARLLATLVNKGMKVVISTHSDYLIREINSLIMLSQQHPQRSGLMKKYGYSEEEILEPDKVGAYLFDNSTIQAMDLTPEEGIIATTFDEVINEQNETSDDIYYTYRNWNKTKGDAA